MRSFFKSLVKVYRLLLSPFFGGQCRFEPTCSAYALDVLEGEGRRSLTKALAKILKRLCSCHPFHPGGFDPA